MKIPDGPTDSEVATFQSASACVAKVRNAQIESGQSILVIGQGVIGVGCLQMAKFEGGGLTIGVDVRQESLELSRKCGADVVIDATKTDPVEEVNRLTDGKGADIVFDCAGGSPEAGLSGIKSLEQAMQMVKKGGTVVGVAHYEGKMDLDLIFMRNKNIKFIFADSPEQEALRHTAFMVASKRVMVELQISHVLKGIENLPEAMKITAHKAKYHATNPAQIVI